MARPMSRRQRSDGILERAIASKSSAGRADRPSRRYRRRAAGCDTEIALLKSRLDQADDQEQALLDQDRHFADEAQRPLALIEDTQAPGELFVHLGKRG